MGASCSGEETGRSAGATRGLCHPPIALGPTEGEALWCDGALTTLMTTAEQTTGADGNLGKGDVSGGYCPRPEDE